MKNYDVIYTWRGERHRDLAGPFAAPQAVDRIAQLRAKGFVNCWTEMTTSAKAAQNKFESAIDSDNVVVNGRGLAQ